MLTDGNFTKADYTVYDALDIFSIDATLESSLGRFVNDSPRKFGNCQMKKFVIKSRPHLCLVAVKDIPERVELRYDYGDTNANLFWRQDVSNTLRI